jgi:FkbM family methyltransferase
VQLLHSHPKMDVTMNSMALFDIVKPARLTSIVDIGANPLDGGSPPYASMLLSGLCEVTGFEPLAAALAELQKRKSPRERYLSYVIADGHKHQLRTCKAWGMTSLFEPDMTTLSLFDVLKELGQVIERTEVDSKCLDDVDEIAFLDFLKMDIQGAELMVLQHGRNKLKQAIAVQAEVSFITLYQNQPAMGEVTVQPKKNVCTPCFPQSYGM